MVKNKTGARIRVRPEAEKQATTVEPDAERPTAVYWWHRGGPMHLSLAYEGVHNW